MFPNIDMPPILDTRYWGLLYAIKETDILGKMEIDCFTTICYDNGAIL